MSKRVFGFHTRLGSGIFAGAILAVVNVTAVRAQSGGPISAPAHTAGPATTADHVGKPTEPPPFDPDKPAARAARAKATPPAAPAPRIDAAPTTPSAGTAQPRRSVTAVDPWAEPETPPAPVSRPTARERAIDPEPRPAPAPVARSSMRRRAEPAKVIGIDSLGRSSEDPSSDPSSAARPRRGAGPGAGAAPAEGTHDALPR